MSLTVDLVVAVVALAAGLYAGIHSTALKSNVMAQIEALKAKIK